MSRKDSTAWMGLYGAIWAVYLLARLLAPPSDSSFLELILVVAATLLLVPLVLLIKRRAGRMKHQPLLGDRPPTRFFR